MAAASQVLWLTVHPSDDEERAGLTSGPALRTAYEAGNDRVASVADPVTGAVSYTRPPGERASMTLPGGGTWTYEYDVNRWLVFPKDDPNSLSLSLSAVVNDQGRRVEYWLDNLGQIRRTRFDQTFDGTGALVSCAKTLYTLESVTGSYSRGQMAQVQNTWNWKDAMGFWQARVLVQNDYTADNAGNRLTNAISDVNGPVRTETYGYDELSRLTSVNYGDGQTQSYTFDPMGNRLSKTDSVSGSENYTYNAANMLLTRGSNAYVNDSNGNTLTGGGHANTWDGENRLTQSVYGGTTSSFTYGADGLRRSMTVGATTTDYVLDGQSVVREKQGAAITATYLHGPRGPEYRRDGSGSLRWYLYDGLGSVLGELDGAGNITATRKYDVYGAVRASTGVSTSKHKFCGALGHPSDDETGLVYMRARYMDPVTGRFVSEDPARRGLDWFVYACDSPTRMVDARGMNAEEALRAITDLLGELEELIEKGVGRDAVCRFINDRIGRLIGEQLSPRLALRIMPMLRNLGACSAEEADDVMLEARLILQNAQNAQQIQGAAGLGNVAAEADEIEADESFGG